MEPNQLKVILTGATGMVGEGVLLECLQNDQVSEVLIVSRRHYDLVHPKLKELIVPDFFRIEEFSEQLTGYDACFYCAGVSSIGMKEAEYTRITYDTTLHVAKVLLRFNARMVFTFVTGAYTDSSAKGKVMWARVKGRTENDLMQLPFRGQYNFRPGFMKPFPGQKHVKAIFRPIIWLYPKLFPGSSLTMQEVGRAMIWVATAGFRKQVLEVKDIKKLAK
ncbi:NAD-dependent epimerase/dehydratase family protein [Paraflavisolibacter sp. H34]|uniref:NAD-dependent epimerase/dehydratase family protein n=1 Tax=Huijunlia imazamoxiresistens TaxID=3127457 RepID=UPI0030175C48